MGKYCKDFVWDEITEIVVRWNLSRSLLGGQCMLISHAAISAVTIIRHHFSLKKICVLYWQPVIIVLFHLQYKLSFITNLKSIPQKQDAKLFGSRQKLVFNSRSRNPGTTWDFRTIMAMVHIFGIIMQEVSHSTQEVLTDGLPDVIT